MASVMDNLAEIARRAGFGRRVQKVSLSQVPDFIEATLEPQGMTQDTPLGPGAPIAPVDGFSRTPRSFNYRAGYNISATPRVNETVSFETLKGLVGVYDIAQMCISHRVDSVRSYDWLLRPAAGITEDMTQVTKLVNQVLAYPDGYLPFRAWLAKYMYDVLAYDAGTLYRDRDLAGRVIGLTVVDGTTIAPTIDAWGRIPGQDPTTGDWAPAYRQYIQGMPWNWLTRQDLIYVPFSPRPHTPYGQAPMERILLNANTDIRFQLYFMQRFTEGNIPQMFASAPESWTPQQVEDWQARWDAFMRGDQSAQQQVKWVPGGSTFDYINRQDYQHEFSMWMLQKTAAAYHVVPADLGWTEKVNKANGQVQENVSERIGVQPLLYHVEDILTSFIQNDLGVPLEFHFDQGTDDSDALLTAQKDQIYINLGVISPSDIRERVYGLAEQNGATIPRFVMTPSGPMPLSMLMDESAPVDQATAAPVPSEINPGSGPVAPVAPVAPAAPVAPMSQRAALAKSGDTRRELAAFHRFVKSRSLSSWRPFTFERVDRVQAHRLNVAAYAGLRKDDGLVSVAGLAVVAQDTGRVLLLQRALDESDANGGFWELPGGHLEPGETARDAAAREWAEEVAQPVPAGAVGDGWTAPAGNYAGFVLVVPDESCVDPGNRDGGPVNPDDPDGDNVESVAWFDPAQLVNNPAVRPELSADISLVLAAVKAALKGADAVPLAKASWRDTADKWPGHRYDLTLTDHHTPGIKAALEQIAASVDVDHLRTRFAKSEGGARITATLTAPSGALDDLTAQLTDARSEGYVSGLHAAGEQVGVQTDVGVNWDTWTPGDLLAASKTVDLSSVLAGVDATVKGISDSTLNMIGERISAGLAAGDPSDKISADIRDLAGSRAEMIAHTEVARAQTTASMDTYRQAGVTEYDLIVSDGACPECVDAQANGPYKLDDDSGLVPIHPRCRCADAPHMDDTTDTSTEAPSVDESPVETPVDDGGTTGPAFDQPAESTQPTAAEPEEPLQPVNAPDPRVIKTLKDMDDFGSHMVSPTTVSDAAKDWVEGYISGSAYQTNALLRGEKTYQGRTIDARTKAYVKKTTKVADDLFDHSTVPEDVRVVRAVRMDAFGGEDKLQSLEGSIFQDKGYMSTSLAEKVSSSVYNAKDAVEMEITVPKGTKALYLAGDSYLRSERELLLDRGTRLSVQSVKFDEKGKKWLVKATVIPGPRPK